MMMRLPLCECWDWLKVAGMGDRGRGERVRDRGWGMGVQGGKVWLLVCMETLSSDGSNGGGGLREGGWEGGRNIVRCKYTNSRRCTESVDHWH